MGHGVSSTRGVAFNPLFCNNEMLEGNERIMDDEWSKTFMCYIMDGGWKEAFPCHFGMEEYVSITLELLARGRFCVSYSYLLPRCRMEEFQILIEAGSLQREDSENAPLPRKLHVSTASAYIRSVVGRRTVDQSARGITIFTSRENAAILFSALYTMFLASTEKENCVELRSLGASVAEDSYGIHCDELTPNATRASPQRSAELLNEIANSFSETDLLKEMKVPTWAISNWRPFEESSLCITIVDTLAPGFPFVYANKSFLRLMGYSTRHVLSVPVGILTGLHTESLLWDVLVEAVSQSKSARVGITLYNRRRQAVFCLVSVKVAGRYAALNYLSTDSLLHVNELQVVDDVMCMLTCVLKTVLSQDVASRGKLDVSVEQVPPPSPPEVDEEGE